jgi:cytochrome P450 family 4
MGISVNAQKDATSEYVRSVHEICKIAMERLTSPIQMHDFLFLLTKNYSLQKKALQVLHEKADSVILQRYKELQDKPKETVQDDGKKKKAFLDLLLEAEVDGRPLSHEEIRQEVATFLFAVNVE